MIAWQVRYKVLWDNDKDGIACKKKAEKHFGEKEGEGRFYLLPMGNERKNKRIIQDVFDGQDMSMIKNELELPKNTSFDKTITSLYYSDNRENVINNISARTINNINEIFDLMDL